MRRIILSIMAIFIAFFFMGSSNIRADGNNPEGNYLTFKITVDSKYSPCFEVAGQYYSLANQKYEVRSSTNSVVGYFITDKYGVGHEINTGLPYIDRLEDGLYTIKQIEASSGFSLTGKTETVNLVSKRTLPDSVTVDTVCQMFGKNTSGNYFSDNQYKLWKVNYGTGVFECGIAEVDAPSEIRDYGSHTISTAASSILERGSEKNELIYKILYYGRSGPKSWDGFSSLYKPFTTRNGTTYYSANETEAASAFVTHNALARAYGANDSWRLQWPLDGSEKFYNWVINQPNAPEDFVVFVWYNYQKYGTQDMFYGYMLGPADYSHSDINLSLAPEVDPVRLLFTKKGSDNKPVANAEFTVSYYNQNLNSYTNLPEPYRRWVFKTDSNGRLYYNDNYKVNSESLFIVDDLAVMLPGTYIIEETKVVDGYIKAEDLVLKIDGNSAVLTNKNNQTVHTYQEVETTGYNMLEQKEGYLKLNKKPLVASNLDISNAVYEVYTDKSCTNKAKLNNSDNYAILTTDRSGNTNTVNLVPGTYYVKETKAPYGFKLDSRVYEVNVKEAETFAVNCNEENQKVTISLVKSDSLTNKPLQNGTYKLVDSSNREVARATSDANGKLSFTIDYVGENNYSIIEVEAPFGYKLDQTVHHITIPANFNFSTTLTVDSNEDGKQVSVRLIKKDANTNELLANGEYGLFDNNGKLISKKSTDENGQVLFNYTYSKDTSYYIKEISAPFGYNLDTNKYEITLDLKYDFTNPIEIVSKEEGKLIKIELNKKDSYDNSPLEGGVYGLFDEDDCLLQKYSTDENGQIIFEVVYDGTTNYYLKELEAPLGYKLDEEIYPITIDEKFYFANVIKVESIEEGKKVNIRVLKTDSTTNKPIEGGKYGLFDSEDNLLEESITNEEGIIEFEYTYSNSFDTYIKEIEAPFGYKLDEDKYLVDINAEFDFKKVYEIESTEEGKTVCISLYKTDSITKYPLENGKYGLFDENDKLLEEKLTDKEGKLQFEYIYSYDQNYYVKEIEAPYGYNLDTTKYEVTLLEDFDFDKVFTIESIEEGKKVNVRVLKTDSMTNKPIEGGKYGLFDSEDNLLEESITNEEGIVKFEYTYSNSFDTYIKEIEVPFGYKLDEDKYLVDINDEFDFKKVYEIESMEEGKTVSISLYKTDSITKYPLENGKYGLFDEDDNLLEEMVTDEEGKLQFEYIYSYDQNYYVKEIEAPYGYNLDTTKYEVILLEDFDFDKDFTIESIEEGKIVKVKLVKKDSETDAYVSNVTYGLFDENDELVDSEITDKSGEVYFNYPYSINKSYYIKEIEGNDYYSLSEEVFEIDDVNLEFDEYIELSAYDDSKVIMVKVVKTDDELNPLSDTEFTLFVVDSNEVAMDIDGNECIKVTDENGEVFFVVAANKEYYLKETKPKGGFAQREKEIYIDIKEADKRDKNDLEDIEPIVYEITNSLIPDTGDKLNIIMSIIAVNSLICLVMTCILRSKVRAR